MEIIKITEINTKSDRDESKIINNITVINTYLNIIK